MDLPDKVGEFGADPAWRTEPPEYIDTPRMRLLSGGIAAIYRAEVPQA